MLNPGATSLDILIRSHYGGCKPALLDVVVLADIYKRCIQVYDEHCAIILTAGLLWATEEKQRLRLCYWPDSRSFDSLRSVPWASDNQRAPGAMEDSAMDADGHDTDMHLFRLQVFEMNPSQPIPRVERISEISYERLSPQSPRHPPPREVTCTRIETKPKPRAPLSKSYLYSRAIDAALWNRLFQIQGRHVVSSWPPTMQRMFRRSVETQTNITQNDMHAIDALEQMRATSSVQRLDPLDNCETTPVVRQRCTTSVEETSHRDQTAEAQTGGEEQTTRNQFAAPTYAGVKICAVHVEADDSMTSTASANQVHFESSRMLANERALQVCDVFYQQHPQEMIVDANKAAMREMVREELIKCLMDHTKKGPAWLNHVRLYAVGGRKYECSECGRYFSATVHLSGHDCCQAPIRFAYAPSSDDSTYKMCIICGSKVVSKDNQELRKHCEEHDAGAKFLFGLNTNPARRP